MIRIYIQIKSGSNSKEAAVLRLLASTGVHKVALLAVW